MSTQSPLPQNDPLLIAFQQLKHTPEYRNAVNWTIKAENENHADGELWFAFAAGWNAREALAAPPADPVREAATALVDEYKCSGCEGCGFEGDDSCIPDNILKLMTALEASK